jgi:hypothetical protein
MMLNRRRTIRRVMQSPLVKKKSPTSAWRPSTYSIRKALRPPRTAYRSLGAVAVAVAVAAVAALAVVAASVGEAAAAVAAAVAAVCPGVVAASAKQITLTYLINASGHGRVRQDRPGQSMSRLRRGPHARVAETANIGRTALQLFRNASARTAWCKNSGGRRTSPLGRSGVVSKMHVLTL